MNCHQNVIWLERLPKLSELPQAEQTDTAGITAANSRCHQQVWGWGGYLLRQLCSQMLLTVAAFVLQSKPNFGPISRLLFCNLLEPKFTKVKFNFSK